MTAAERRREDMRFARDAYVALAAALLGSGVFGVILAVAVTNDDALGLGPRPATTAATFSMFLLASLISYLAALNYHREVLR